jgi:hypothetical protein
VEAVIGPQLLQPDQDSYPLSTYPMFAEDRGPTSGVTAAVGIGPDDEVVRLSAREVSGTDEVMLAVETVVRAVNQGRAEELCASVASGLDRPEVRAVEIRTELVDSVGWLAGQRTPAEVRVHARCEVGPP